MKVQPHRIKYYVLGFYLLLLTVWQGLFSAQILPDYLFPSPWQVVRRLWELAADNYLWPSLKATFQRMGIGFSIAATAGLLIGLLMGMSRVVNSCLRSLFLGLQTLPTAAWVPVSLLIYGLSDRGINEDHRIDTADGVGQLRSELMASDDPDPRQVPGFDGQRDFRSQAVIPPQFVSVTNNQD